MPVSTMPANGATAPASPPRRGRAVALPVVSLLLLVATVAVPLLRGNLLLLAAVGLVLLVLSVVSWSVGRGPAAGPRRRNAVDDRPGRRVRRATSAVVELALHLSPVGLLTFVFPLAVSRMGGAEVGGVELPTLLLASSLTVPWLSMAVCLPLYRAVGTHMSAGDHAGARARLLQVWPATFVQSLPAVLLFAVVVQSVMRWSATALGAYLVLTLLHAAFSQSLVVANIERNRPRWAAAWVAYAAALIVAPTAWFLPPLVAMATQLLPLRREIGAVQRLTRLENLDVAADLLRGVLLGSVLWSHVFVVFLVTRGDFPVVTVFVAVLPAVLAYNYYFVRLAPGFDRGVLQLRRAMEVETHALLASHSDGLTGTVVTSLARTAFVGAVLAFGITVTVAALGGLSVTLVAAVCVASWVFLMTTVACYKLDYVGQQVEAQLFSAAHLLLVVVVTVVVPVGVESYLWLVGLGALLLAAVVHRCLAQWRSSEYALFWRHATAW